MIATARNFVAIGVHNDRLATVYTDSSFSHKGRTFTAPATGRPATVAVLDSGFSLRHRALASAFEDGYDFVQHSNTTISVGMDGTSIEGERIVRASEMNLDNPTAGVVNYFFDEDAIHDDDKSDFRANYDSIPGGALAHGTSVAGIIAAQRISATVTVGGDEKTFETVPGIAPGTKIVPIQLLGALTVNACTDPNGGGDCIRSRPHLLVDRRTSFQRLNSAITLAKRDNSFAMNMSLGERGLPVTIALANENEVVAALQNMTATVTVTYAAGELIINQEQIAMFSPLLLPPDQRVSLSREAKDAITSGDGMAIVVAAGNSGDNDYNGQLFKRRGGRTKISHAGEEYDEVRHAKTNYRIATDLSVPLPGWPGGGQAVDVREYGFGKVLDINGTQVTTRSLPEYILSLWRFPGHEDIKPYWLSVVGYEIKATATMDVSNGIRHVTGEPVIAELSSGCGVVWERCIAAPLQGSFPTHNPLSAINAGYEYDAGTSQAAPYVTGALALLKRYFPDLRADTATEILLATTDDLGVPGPDPVYGMGGLNIGRALNPVGRLSASPGSSTFIDGSALKLSGALAGLDASDATVVGYDKFSRPFGSSLRQFIEIQPGSAQRLGATQIIDQLQRRQLAEPAGGVLHYRDESLERFSWPLASDTFVSHDWCQLQCATSGDSWGFMAAAPQLTSLTRLRHSLVPESGIEVEAAMAGGPAEVAWRSMALRIQRQPAAGIEWGVEIGTAQEKDSLLGSELSGAFALADGAASRFVHVRGSWQLAENVLARGRFGRARTEAAARAESVVLGISDLVAESATASLSTRGVLRRADALTVEWEVPLQASSGMMHLRTGGYDENGERFTGVREVALAASGRERLWRISYAAPLASLGGSAWLAAAAEHRRRSAAHAGSEDWRYSLAWVWKH